MTHTNKPNTMPIKRKTVSSENVLSKHLKTEVEIHASQTQLAGRAKAAIDEGGSVLITAPPGYGKTRAIRSLIDSMAEESQEKVLTIYVSKTPALARKQSPEIGSLYKTPFLFARLNGVEEALKREIDVRLMMTQTMFKKLVYDEDLFINSFAEPLGNPKIHLVIDEVHCFYVPKSPRMPNAMKCLLTSYPSIRVTGITATPQLEAHMETAVKVFGKEPSVQVYTDDEEEQFKVGLLSHQPPPSKWKVVPLPVPNKADFPIEFEALQTIIVGNSKLNPNVHIDGWIARDNILAKVISNQVHGTDDSGGLIFKKVSVKGVQMKQVGEDSYSFIQINRPESVVIVHRHPTGNEVHHALLEGIIGTEGVRPCVVHDLRAGDIASAEDKLASFIEDVRAGTEHTVLGIIDKTHTEGSNDFA